MVWLLWMSDQLITEISTWQHITLTTNLHAPGGTWTHNLDRWANTDLHLRLGSHLERPVYTYYWQILHYWTNEYIKGPHHLILSGFIILMQTLQLWSNCLYNFPHTPCYNFWSKYSPMHQTLHPYHVRGKINNYFKKRRRKIKYYLLNTRKHFNVHLNCIWM